MSLFPVSYTHIRAHETVLDLVCRLLLDKKNDHTSASNDTRHPSTTHKISYSQRKIPSYPNILS